MHSPFKFLGKLLNPTGRRRPSRNRSVLGEGLEARHLLTTNLLISEVHFDPLFGDSQEDLYFEVRGPASATIDSSAYLVVVDSDHDKLGEINSVFHLGGLQLGSNGHLVVLQGNANYAVDPGAAVLQGTDEFSGTPGNRYQSETTVSDRFEHVFGSNSILLVTAATTPLANDDVDTNDDGVLDVSWNILDGVSVLGTFLGGDANDKPYGNVTFRGGGNTAVSPPGTTVLDVDDYGYVARIGDSTGWAEEDWMAARTRELTTDGFDFEVDAYGGNELYREFVGYDLDHVGALNFFSSIEGDKFHDHNGNGLRDISESGINGATVYLDLNNNGQLDSQQIVVEPDAFAVDAVLSNAVPGVTLTIEDSSGDLSAFDVEAENSTSQATTGTLVFSQGTQKLRMDFLRPVESVSIDFSSQTASTRAGILETYDATGTLLATYNTGSISNTFDTMTITRPTADIAFALAYPDDTVSPFGDLDHLRFTRPEPSTVTDELGSFRFASVDVHLAGSTNVAVRTVDQADQRQTAPLSGNHSLVINQASHFNGIGFGVESSRPFDIIGRTDGGEWWIAGSNGNGFVTEYFGQWNGSVTWEDTLTGDVDGDGNADVIGRVGQEWWVSKSNGTGFESPMFWGYWPATAAWTDVQIVDVNGDQLADILGRNDSGEWWVAVSNGSNFTSSQWSHWSTNVTWDSRLVGDFNGDGMTDLAGRTNGYWFVDLSNGTDFDFQYWGRWSTGPVWQDVRVGDFNGDGMDDIAGRANGAWWLSLSNETYFTIDYWGQWSTSLPWDDVLVADFDGDGMDDIAGRRNGRWWVARSQGSFFGIEHWGAWSTLPTWLDVQIGDIDGDGKDDIVGRAGGDWWTAHSTGGFFTVELWGQWAALNWNDVKIARFGDFAGQTGGQTLSTVPDAEDEPPQKRRSSRVSRFT